MIYKEKSTQKEYEFIEKNTQDVYILRRTTNISIGGAKIIEEEIGAPLEVLQSDFELVEE